MFKYIKKLFKNNYLLLAGAMISMLLLSFDGIISPHFLGQFTDRLTQGSYNTATLIVRNWLLALLGIVAVKLLNSFLSQRLINNVNYQNKLNISDEAIQGQNLNKSSSAYIALITSEFYKIEEKLVRNLFTFIFCFFQGIITFIYLIRINMTVGLIFVGLGCIPAIIPRLTANWLKRGSEQWQETNNAFIADLNDYLQGRRLMLRYQAFYNLRNKLKESLFKNERNYFKMEFNQALADSLISLFYISGLLLSLMLGIREVVAGRLTAGELISIYMAAERVVSPLITAASLYNVMQATEPILKNIFEEPKKLEIPPFEVSSLPADQLLELEALDIGYGDKVLIKDINIQIDKGDKILLTANSGSGKSSFLKTLMSEIPPLGGSVIENKTLSDKEGQAFGLVEQAPYVYEDSLLFNLTFGHPIDRQVVLDTLEFVGLGKFAKAELLDQPIGKEENKLSGGELKRLELARAILFQKEILLIDEAFSGLDPSNAEKIHELIMNYPGTVIDVEHHFSPEMKEKYSRIITIKDQRMKEEK